MQIPAGESADFRTFLRDLHFEFVDETDNPAYQLFLT